MSIHSEERLIVSRHRRPHLFLPAALSAGRSPPGAGAVPHPSLGFRSPHADIGFGFGVDVRSTAAVDPHTARR
ncbi:hypothetical protein WDA79_09280, partial [Streptomyces sp. A475]|uniref:hypothetical protein n=1 Tax=Streptomyces sp. A475 TaxID=3131976 RepID=UPI0030C93287